MAECTATQCDEFDGYEVNVKRWAWRHTHIDGKILAFASWSYPDRKPSDAYKYYWVAVLGYRSVDSNSLVYYDGNSQDEAERIYRTVSTALQGE